MNSVTKIRNALSLVEDPKIIQDHANAVKIVAEKVRLCYNEKRPFRIFHGHTNSTRQNVLRKNESIDISQLNRVLRFDLDKKRVLAEPNVPMDSLVQATLKHGLIPPVVPEFPGITVGGSFAGTAGESSSFKHGFFDKTVTAAEVVLPDGTLTTISDGQDAELFKKIPSTMGTLGVTTAVEIQLMEAKRYVLSTYHPVESMQAAVDMIEKETLNPDLDFLDGIMFSPTSGAVITGRLVDSIRPGCPVQRFSRAWDPWYYVHVREKISDTAVSPVTEAIPIADYFFRWDRGGFWVGRSAFKYFHVPFHRVTRWFLDDFLHTRMLYKALHASKNVISYVVQDCALPYDTAAEFIKYTDKNLPIYPLWLCPLPTQDSAETFHPHHTTYSNQGTQMRPMLNIGFWGFGPRKHSDYLKANRTLEEKLTSLGGKKWLYSQTYYTSKEFWSLYPREWYDHLREKYRASHLPDVWQKVRVDVEKDVKYHNGWKGQVLRIWPVAGLYGILRAILSGEWRIPRRVRIVEMDVVRRMEAERKKIV
jgi:FAD/FMN-containing dehydrogenase